MEFILTSNIFLFLPVIAAAYKGEWIYFAFALGLSISSPTYHYLKEVHSSKRLLLKVVKNLDWLIAIGSYAFMYYYIFTRVPSSLQIPLFVALTLTLVFFWYGYKFSSYRRFHPWFHVVAPIVSSVIVLSMI